jgi:pimeloyl-ACP methyl ester carboxylesterase
VADVVPAEEFLELAEGRVHLLRGGPGEGSTAEPVLFLHAGGAGEWHPFHGLLASRGFEVIAPDHPGFGKSDDFPSLDSIDDLVFHYLDVLDALGLERPHVVGGSFGGWIAAELAVYAPHRVGSLTLLSAAGLRLPEHPVTDLFLLPPAKLPATLFHTPPPAPASQTRASETPASETRAPGTPPDLDAIIAAYREATSLARFCWVPFFNDPKLERRLHRITAPTLVAAPSDDRVIPVEHARRYAERIANASYTEVPECGHAMYFERPAEFAALVTAFLSSHPLVTAESGAGR